MPTVVVVEATFDQEAGVWFTESADLPGLHVEAATVDELNAKLPGAVLDLLEEGAGTSWG